MLGQYNGCGRRLPVSRKFLTSVFEIKLYGTAPRVINSQKTIPNDHLNIN